MRAKREGEYDMANQEQRNILRQDTSVWNTWRTQHPEASIDLSYTDLSGANLSGANLSGQDLSNKDLGGANLSGADLSRTLLIGTKFTRATLTDCIIYGTAAWNVQLDQAVQKNLIITQKHEATITIDNLKVAQFIYLMLNNKEIRDVINTLTTKSVLILGRFTPQRKAVLDALRDALRIHNYLPILFDFEKPSSLNLTETVTTLAHLSRFIIIDLTDPSSSPHEAASVIPDCQVPIQPIFEGIGKPYSMFSDFKLLPWVLDLYRYRDKDALITSLKEHIIEPAEQRAEELGKLKNSK
jgi:Pentapeptide repeats (8 copies)